MESKEEKIAELLRLKEECFVSMRKGEPASIRRAKRQRYLELKEELAQPESRPSD